MRASMADGNKVASNKMRSLVTHKKLKEIAMAQAQEVSTHANMAIHTYIEAPIRTHSASWHRHGM